MTREEKLEKRRAYYAKTSHRNKAYSKANAAKISERHRVMYAANPERFKEKSRVAYHKNKERYRAQSKAWRARNRDKNLADKKRWWAENKAENKIKKKAYYQKNKERIKAKVAAYIKLHPEVAANAQARRRALKRGSQVDPAGIREWMREVRSKPFARCHWCGTKVKGRKIQFDHIVALNAGGPHAIGNLCASCMDCNYSKHDRALTEWVCRGQTFLKLT